MDPIRPTNSVERRMLKINDDWRYFTEQTDAKLLYWQLPEADHALLNTFFQVQGEYARGVQVYAGEFNNALQYVTDTLNQLYHFYDGRREGALAQGINANWILPERESNETDINYLFRVLSELSAYHPDIFTFFTLVLVPYQVTSYTLFSEWITELIAKMHTNRWITEHVRIVSFGEQGDWLQPLMKSDPDNICFLQRDYQSKNIPRELLAESSDRGAGADFRRIFIELFSVVKDKDPKKLAKLVEQGINISQKQRWFDQMVVIQLTAGAAYLSWGDDKQSLHAYQQAVFAGEQAIKKQHPAGEKLVANALFGMASVYLKSKYYQDAAQCYQLIPPFTIKAEDYILTVEAWRMVAFCWQNAKEKEQAIQAGLQALESGLFLDEPLRLNSSLPIAANSLLEVIPDNHQCIDDMEEKLQQLFGEDWSEILASTHDVGSNGDNNV
ncbi:tetratricopeptide repeat protein [Pragia fontium]|uniref:tetratricopeptide repeat protein n=1 Tax=Pragia fontium TaxID=82985 RepID=UPI000F6F121E|nr:hypothetical protein [Pragia fontium]VEJ57111.1 Uncharacterised protein [Pragia fontium]